MTILMGPPARGSSCERMPHNRDGDPIVVESLGAGMCPRFNPHHRPGAADMHGPQFALRQRDDVFNVIPQEESGLGRESVPHALMFLVRPVNAMGLHSTRVTKTGNSNGNRQALRRSDTLHGGRRDEMCQ